MKKILKQFSGTSSCYLSVSAKEAAPFLEGKNKRLLVTLEERVKMHCTLKRNNELGYFIFVSKSNVKELALDPGEEVRVKIEKDSSPFQFKVPEVLMEVLATDPAAKEVFDGLTDGNKRSIMHLVNMLKSIDKQIERSLLIAERLKKGVVRAQDILKK